MSAAIAPDVLHLLERIRAAQNVPSENNFWSALSEAQNILDLARMPYCDRRARLVAGAAWALYALELHDAAASSAITIEIGRNELAPGNEHLNLEIVGGPVPWREQPRDRINPVDPSMRAAAGSTPVTWTPQTNGTWIGAHGDLLVGMIYPHETGGWGWTVYTTPPDVEQASGVCEFRQDAFAAAEEAHSGATGGT